MADWKARLEARFGAYQSYRPGKYIDKFPELRAAALKNPVDLTADDIATLLWKARHANDRALVARFLPEIMERYDQGHLSSLASRLYATLLVWSSAWSADEYAALTDVLLTHWEEALKKHRPPHLTVTDDEVTFLLLWLEDTAPVEPILLDLAQRHYRQEVEYEWDDSWGSETWTPFINRVRSEPARTLLIYATGGELNWPDLPPSPVRDERIVSALRRTGIVTSQ